MSRPSKAESERLERLEGISAQAASVKHAARIARLRVRQLRRQIPETERLAGPLLEEVHRIQEGIASIQEMIHQVLVSEQQRRTERNEGGTDA
jgi:hypothetical protein